MGKEVLFFHCGKDVDTSDVPNLVQIFRGLRSKSASQMCQEKIIGAVLHVVGAGKAQPWQGSERCSTLALLHLFEGLEHRKERVVQKYVYRYFNL